jgi:hypothetical protein
LYKKGLYAMVEGINILSHKRSLKLSVSFLIYIHL